MKKLLLSASVICLSVGLSAQTYFSEDFNSAPEPAFPAGFTTEDLDGDGNEWETTSGWGTYDPFTTAGIIASSRSWNGAALTPDNFMTFGPIDLTSASGTVVLQWNCGSMQAGWYEEEYSVYIGTASSSTGLIPTGAIHNEILSAPEIMFNRSVDISAHIGSSVYIGFRHHNTVDMNMIGVDDIVVKTLSPADIELTSISTPTVATTGSMASITGVVTNTGGNPITAFDLTWDDGSGPQTENITASIASGATYNFTHGTQLSVASSIEYALSICATVPSDGDASNNCLNHSVSGLAFTPSKHVVIEEGTGTWCGWCPRGAVAMDALINDASRPNFIGIAVHNGDPMTVAAYDNGVDLSGYPGMNVNRKLLGEGVSTTAMQNLYDQEVVVPTIANVSVTGTYDGTGAISIDVSANFATQVSSEYRLAAVLVENGVTGTSSGYNQANYYAGGGSGAMGGYESLPDPVPASQMVYDHVGRVLYGGYTGQAGSITVPTTASSTQSYNFTGTVGSFNASNLSVVGMLINSTTGEIMNANEGPLGFVGIPENDVVEFFNVYPNPATTNATLAFDLNTSSIANINIVNAMGQTIYNQSVAGSNGLQGVTINTANMANGMYFVNLTVEGKVVTKKLSINK